MANFMKIFDTVDFKPLEVSEQQRKDFFSNNTQTKPLIVKIAATHSGLITRNNGFYLPDRMRKGAASFTAQYNKPIQIHHDDGGDPVGRVIKAEYVDIGSGIDLINKVNNALAKDGWKDFISGKLSFINSINFISDVLNRKDSVLDDPDFQGAGFIKLTAAISDQEAATKILDGRYLTGSVGLTTDAAVCSVCKQDWVQTDYDERCVHKPGKMYDGKKAFVITGNLNYEEYSFVNVPADRHSRVMEINVNGVTDSFEESVGKKIAVNLITDNINNEHQEERMDIKAVVSKLIEGFKSRFTILGDEFFTDFLASVDDKWAAHDEIHLPVELELHFDKSALEKIFLLTSSEEKAAAIKVIRPFMEDTAVTKLSTDTYENSEKFYDALNIAEWNDYSESEDEAIIAYLAEHPEDAKLSTAQRKRLPGSSFCGPNKSFPVPDCAHVTAARRLIGRASVSSATKSKILACVSRKATAMSCSNKGNDAKQEQKEAVTCDCAGKFSTQIDELIINRDKAINDLAVLQKEIDTNKAKLVESEKALALTRDELKLTHDDLIQMSDQLVEAKTVSTNYLVDNVLLFSVLSGEVIDDQTKAHQEMVALGEDAIQNKLSEIKAKVDMKKITDSINSGLTKNPTGTVTDPTVNSSEPKYDKQKISDISQEFLRIQFGGRSAFGSGPAAAEAFRKDMQSKGLLPVG